jgi:hypothetical protein
MSVYNPPNFEEYLSVFNPANWLPPSAGEIDTAYLDANYLRFPFAQGSENLLNTTINGNLALTGGITFSDSSVMKSLGYISIVSYGADPTGVADSTTAIQNAVNALTLTNNTLFIPRGRYLITSTILIQNKQNCNIFSEGCLYCNTAIVMLGITNVYNFTINGSLILDGVSNATGATGIDIYDTAGGYITSDSVNQLNINGLLLTNLSVGAECRAIGFPSKLFSNFQISECAIGLRVRGEYFQFSNINIFGGTYGILNYGGNNTYTNGIIKTCDYGMIVRNNPALAGNPDHNGCYGITFNHILNCPIILSYINLGWVVENCNFWANGGSLILGNPLGDNAIVAPAYQSYSCGGVYIQGGTRVNLSNNIFGLNENNPIVLNGFSGCSIVNNTIFQTTGSNYISIIGAYLLNFNSQNIISNNNFNSLATSVQGVNFDTTFHTADFLYSNTSSTNILNNQGSKVVSVIDSSVSGTVFIDGTCEVYTIVEGTPATIYISNAISTRFTINYRRTGSYTFTSAPSTTTVKIFKPISPGFATPIATPVICDGLFLNSDDGAGNKVIQFQKQGQYIFEPAVNDPILLAGNYTIRPVFPDANLYYSVALGASSIDLRSALFFNSDVNITDGVLTPNTTILLQSSTLSGGNAFYTGSKIKIFNDSSSVLALSGTGGVFSGAYGNGASTIPVPDNTWVVVLFDGTNYLINERSANITLQLAPTGSVDHSANANYTNATLRITPNAGTYTITIPSPDTQTSQNTTIRIINASNQFGFALSLNSGIFTGKYGSGLTTLNVPNNTIIELFSNGTNWVCQDRAGNISFTFLPNGTTLDWTSNLQFLDSIIEFVQPDSALITQTPLSGTATQSGNILTTVSTTGTISIGSIITLSTRRMIVSSQLTGTAGGIGTYLVNVSQTVGATTAYTGFGGTGTVGSGTFTMGTLQTANIPTFTPSGAVNPASTIGVATSTSVASNPFYVLSGTGSGSSCGSSCATNSSFGIGTVAYFSTLGTTVNLPPATTSYNRMITFNNNSNNPVNLTTSAGTALFTGSYGQAQAGNFTFPNNFFLRPSETVVLMSDGTNWETQQGTSLSGARSFTLPQQTTVSSADRAVQALTNIYTSDLTYSSLYGVQNVSNVFSNRYPFPITVSITANISWGNALVGGTTTCPQRLLQISSNNVGTGVGATNFAYNVLNVPFAIGGTAPSYTLTSSMTGGITQTASAVFTLKSGENITISVGKVNGGTNEQINAGSTIFIQRIA